MGTLDECERHLAGRCFNKALLAGDRYAKLGKFKQASTDVIETYIANIDAVGFVVYKCAPDKQLLVFATVYHLYAGRFDGSGKLHEQSEDDTLLGYKINYESLRTQIYACLRRCENSVLHSLRVRLRRTRRSLLWAHYDNLGHHIWNEQSGLDNLLDDGVFGELNHVLIGNNDFFNTLTLFEDNQLKVQNIASHKVVPFAVPGAVLRSTDLRFRSSTRRRLLQNIQQASDSPRLKRIHQVLRSFSCAIVLQIRKHGRRWISEDTKLPVLIRWINDNFPEAAIILDGFSCSSARKTPYKPSDEQLFIQEMMLLRPGKVVSTQNMSVSEKCALLQYSDIVVGPIGSNGVLANWLLHKPLVSYGPSSYYSWTQADSQSVPEDRPPPISYVPVSSIEDYKDSSYDFPLDELIALLKPLLSKLRNSRNE